MTSTLAKASIAAAFLILAGREPEDFYLTISDKASGKLIQFTGGKGTPLCVGVSELSLSKEEIPRARKVFSDFGVPAISSYPNNDPTLAVEIFTGCFGDDYSVGPRLVERFFREVYLLPDDFDALIEED